MGMQGRTFTEWRVRLVIGGRLAGAGEDPQRSLKAPGLMTSYPPGSPDAGPGPEHRLMTECLSTALRRRRQPFLFPRGSHHSDT